MNSYVLPQQKSHPSRQINRNGEILKLIEEITEKYFYDFGVRKDLF